jgi:hypothetical protein
MVYHIKRGLDYDSLRLVDEDTRTQHQWKQPETNDHWHWAKKPF